MAALWREYGVRDYRVDDLVCRGSTGSTRALTVPVVHDAIKLKLLRDEIPRIEGGVGRHGTYLCSA